MYSSTKNGGRPPKKYENAERENEMQTLAILTNGGDTCALNASIKSIRDSAYRIGYKKIYGIRRGYQGLIDKTIDDITHREIDVRIGGSCLGSLRVSPTDPCTKEEKKETEESHKINKKRCRKMAQCLKKYKVDVLVVIGGDGTLQATKMFQDWVQENRADKSLRPFEIMRFLKTIDNDIRTFTNFEGVEVSLCPGFPSAVKKVISCVEDLRVTARTAERAFSVETMGRDAGWLAASTTYGGAEILLVREHLKYYERFLNEGRAANEKMSDEEISDKVMCDLVNQIASFYQKNRNVLIGVAEGFEPVVNIEAIKKFAETIRDLYGTRKKVGVTELVTIIVSPVLEFYFWCLSHLCEYGYKSIDVKGTIKKIHELKEELKKTFKTEKDLQEAVESLVDDYFRIVLEKHQDEKQQNHIKSIIVKYVIKVIFASDHPLKNWDIAEKLRESFGLNTEGEEDSGGNDKTNPPSDTVSDSGVPPDRANEPNVNADKSEGRSPTTLRPYKFEIRPHRTDYTPRSGPPSSYDYKLATVLGEKIGEMLLKKEYGSVPALDKIVDYKDLTIDRVKCVRIDEIKTLNFDSDDYFDSEIHLDVSHRIKRFFRTITSGPDNLEDAIHEYNKEKKR